MAEIRGPYKTPAPTRGANPGERRGGRRPGGRNKVTREAKAAIAECFERMGSIERLTEWANDHPKEFYTLIWAKIIPLQITGEGGGAIEIRAVERRIISVPAVELKLVSDASA